MKRILGSTHNPILTRFGTFAVKMGFGRAGRWGSRYFWMGFSILPILLVLLVLLRRRQRQIPAEFQIAGRPVAPARTTPQPDVAVKETVAQTPSRVQVRSKAEDDFTVILGIGPKITKVFKSAGIQTYAQLANTKPGRLAEALRQAGVRAANPMDWPEQARLAARGEWQALESLQSQIREQRNK